jgi:hypothetical protein
MSTSRTVPDSPFLNSPPFLTSRTDFPDRFVSSLEAPSAGLQALGSAVTHLICSALCILGGASLIWSGVTQDARTLVIGGLVALAVAALSGLASGGWQYCEGQPLWKAMIIALPTVSMGILIAFAALAVVLIFVIGVLSTAGLVTLAIGV